jgi:hypothetical protein
MRSRGITDSVPSADMAVSRAVSRIHAGRTTKAVRTVITVICHLGVCEHQTQDSGITVLKSTN